MAQHTVPDHLNIETGNQNGNQQRHETIPLHRMGSSISQQERAEAAERRRMRQIFNMVCVSVGRISVICIECSMNSATTMRINEVVFAYFKISTLAKFFKNLIFHHKVSATSSHIYLSSYSFCCSI